MKFLSWKRFITSKHRRTMFSVVWFSEYIRYYREHYDMLAVFFLPELITKRPRNFHKALKIYTIRRLKTAGVLIPELKKTYYEPTRKLIYKDRRRH